MNLQAEKIELVRLVLDTDDIDLIQKIKAFLMNHSKTQENSNDLTEFYENFRGSIREVKQDQEGKGQLKDAKDWLNEL